MFAEFKRLVFIATFFCLSAAAGAADVATASSANGVPEVRIVNGIEATKFKYTKWMLGMLSVGDELPWCGAAYIGKNWAMTAAHCVVHFASDPAGYRVEANRHNWLDRRETGLKLPITRVYVHPHYNGDKGDSNDIALLKLTGGPTLELFPELDDGSYSLEDEDRTFKVIGWGDTKQNGTQSEFLRQALVNLIPSTTCQALYYKKPGVITPSMICAKADGTDTCEGDSGGPMFVETEAKSPVVLVGITSWGEECAGVEPGVYSRVSYFRCFIDRTVGCAKGTTFTGGACQRR